MTTLTQNQSFQRWDTLPDNLREALCLEANSDFVWKTCTDEHIPEEKVKEVSRVAGYVLMGFLHPEDVSQELKERMGLDAKTAASIQDSLNKRIFEPLRPDIDRVYAPISKLEVPAISSGPKMFNDVAVPSAITPKPTTPKPSTLSDIGWSKTPTPAPTPTPKSIAPTGTPTMPPATPTEPAPVMLHQDTTFKAPEKNAGFTLSRPGVGAEVRLGQGAGVPPPPARPAVLEFGGAPATPASKPPTPPAQNAIHYTELASGPRNVSQVAPPTPPPGVPVLPKPPVQPIQQVPQPPSPPQKPGSAIVKDFL